MQDVPALELVSRLRAALDSVAVAMAAADTQALLEAEPHLASALAAVTRLTTVSPAARDALRDEIVRTQQAVDRCRQMGAAAIDVARVTLDAEGWPSDYGRGGHASTPTLRGVQVRERR